jgi:hypothetical protein
MHVGMIGADNGDERALSGRDRGNGAAMIMERNPKRDEHSTRLGPKTASVVGGLLAPSQHARFNKLR